MIHIHCLAQCLAPINVNYYDYPFYKPCEIMVCSNKMLPACATTCHGIKMQMGPLEPALPFLDSSSAVLSHHVGLTVLQICQACSLGLYICWSSTQKLFLPDPRPFPTPTLLHHVVRFSFFVAHLEVFICLLVYCLSPALEGKIHGNRKCGCHVHHYLPSTQNNLAAQSKSSGKATMPPKQWLHQSVSEGK